VTLDHGVGGDWLTITPTQADSMFDRAIARKAWIAPYQTVAAYWRASKVMDTVTAKASGAGWTMSWVSPHAKMPRKVALRVRLDTTVFGALPTLRQNGATIARESDSSYVIDFMQTSLQVTKAGATGVGRPVRVARAARPLNTIRLKGLPPGTTAVLPSNIAGQASR